MRRLLKPTARPHPLLTTQRYPTRTFTTSYHLRHATDPTSSISSSEVSHFSALAGSWWDPYGPSRLLHLMNPLRHDFINSCLASSSLSSRSQKLDYLDVGCGGGIFAESAARLSSTNSVTAIDPSGDVLNVAKEHARRDPVLLEEAGKLRYLHTTIEDLPRHSAHRPGGYDVLTLFEVLEHVPSPSEFLASCAGQIKPGGWLILSTIARTWTSWFTTKVVAEDVLGMVPRGTHDWRKYLNEHEVRAWFQGGERVGQWEHPRAMGVIYIPGLGWREVRGGEEWGNYFFGIRKRPLGEQK